MKKYLLSFVFLLGLAMFATPAQAATCTFTGAVSPDWQDDANWDCGVIPDANDDVIIPAATSTLISTGTISILSLFIDATGELEIDDEDVSFTVQTSTTNDGTFISILGGNPLNFNGTTVNTGTMTSGLAFFDGDLTNSGSINTAGGVLGISGNFDNTGGTIATTNRVNFYGATSTSITGGFTIAGDIDVSKTGGATLDVTDEDIQAGGDVRLNSGTLQLNGNFLRVGEDWDNQGGTLDSSVSGTVIMIGGGATFISEESGFYNLGIDVGAGSSTTLLGDIVVANRLTMYSGELDADQYDITIGGTGLSGDEPFRFFAGTFDPGTGTLIYTAEDRTEGTTIGLDPDHASYHNLDLRGNGMTYEIHTTSTLSGDLSIAAGATLLFDDVHSVTVDGTITNLGLVDLDGVGQLLHDAESIAVTDSDGTTLTTANSGALLYVTLQDSDENLDGTLVETLTVVVTGDAASGSDSETLTLTETGPATGIFRNTTGIRVAHILSSSVTTESGRLDILASGVLTATYTDPDDMTDTASDDVAASTTPVVVTSGSSGGGGGGLPAAQVQAPVTQFESVTVDDAVIPVHTLLKLPCPAGAEVNHPCKAVYYLSSQGKRHAFPNDKVYFTWYENFDGVQLVNESQMSQIPLGKNVTYKPGVRMVKFTTDPKVYAVEKNGVLRWVTSEAVAIELYGAAWNTMIDDINDAFHANYRFGADITSSADYNAITAEASVTHPSDSLQM